MRKIGIATDSHSGIGNEEAKRLGIWVLPMPFSLDEESYLENRDITREQFFEAMKAGKTVSTSQPSIQDVLDLWDEMLKECETVLYVPISSGLSGSYETALMLSREEKYEGKVFVVDNGRVSTPMHRSILDAVELVEQGLSAAEVRDVLEKNRGNMTIYVTVDDLEYLKRGGRINASTAAIGNILHIKPILQFDVGTLNVYKKARGFKKARQEMLAAMKEALETTFRESYDKGEVYLLAASSADPETTADWVKEIEAYFPGMEVMCDDLSLGVSCHIGPGGLGIGCSCKPSR